MRYELPKSYKRMAANGYPQPAMNRAQPSPAAPAEFRPRSHKIPTPPPSATNPAKSNATPQQSNTVSASTYQRLLVELQSRNREREHLRQVTQDLLAELSELNAKYEQAISSPPQRLSVAPMSRPKGMPLAPNQETALPAERRKLANSLPTFGFLERFLQPNHTPTERPKTDTLPSSTATGLPELRFLNRLRQANHHNPKPHNPKPRNPETHNPDNLNIDPALAKPDYSPAIDVPEPETSESNMAKLQRALSQLSAVEPQAPTHRNRIAEEAWTTDPSAPLDSVPPLSDGAYENDYEYESPYQKARQEHAKNTPLWMWLVAWLLLLPISAGLGYTFVQWVMNSGTPVQSPAAIEQAE